MAIDINKVKDSRVYNAKDIWEVRGSREGHFSEWHTRVGEVDALYSGAW
jgi:hypothetical protein